MTSVMETTTTQLLLAAAVDDSTQCELLEHLRKQMTQAICFAMDIINRFEGDLYGKLFELS